MITQTTTENEPHFVITMAEHNDLCGQLARSFGNDKFERLKPFDEVVYTVQNHDRGWRDYDLNPDLDPETGLPCLMTRTPKPDAVRTNRGSPDFNEAHHPYCGLLSSMHTWGLYNGRYGYSRYVIRTRTETSITVQDQFRALIDEMLAAEVARQERLKAQITAIPSLQSWVDKNHLFQNYKQLQFFDTLALYFHLYHASERGEEVYVHVPLNSEADTNVTVKRVSDEVYSLDPYPFVAGRLKLICRGRYMKPLAAGTTRDQVGAVLRSLPADTQTYELVPGR
jgi:hypothetical protein